MGGGPAKGPYLARYEDLSVKPQFQSRQTATDPNAAKSIYTAQIPFAKPGRYEVLGIAKQGKKLVAATLPQAGVVVKKAADDPIPAVGTAPPRIHTPTITDVGGNAAAIDTRLPPSSMHDVDFADVLGKKPVMLIFATPQLCQSRVCGPVVDLAEQVKANADELRRRLHPHGGLPRQPDRQGHPAADGRVPPADRAVALHLQQAGQGGGADRGRVLGARAERGDREGEGRLAPGGLRLAALTVAFLV